MKEIYEIPEIEISIFDTVDVITVSEPATFSTAPGEGGGDIGDFDDF